MTPAQLIDTGLACVEYMAENAPEPPDAATAAAYDAWRDAIETCRDSFRRLCAASQTMADVANAHLDNQQHAVAQSIVDALPVIKGPRNG